MMKSVSYVNALNEHYGAMGFPPYEWTINKSAPLTRLDKPLEQWRDIFLISGGHCR